MPAIRAGQCLYHRALFQRRHGPKLEYVFFNAEPGEQFRTFLGERGVASGLTEGELELVVQVEEAIVDDALADIIDARYDELWAAYPGDKQRHAYAVLCLLIGADHLTPEVWIDLLRSASSIQEYVRDQVRATREKDFENPFRQATYRSREEMTASIGTIDDNSFVQQVREETDEFLVRIGKAIDAAR